MTPRQRAEAPFWFASAVVSLYENKLIIPQIEKELAVQQNLIKNAAFVTTPKREVTH